VVGRSCCIYCRAWMVSALGGRAMTQQMVWKCEQWLGGQVKEQNVFLSEEQAREYVRRLEGRAPDLVFKIEPMPIQHVWN
jgi:hypothetical protein